MIDFERLDAAITYAVENPERFDFGVWFARTACGTTACLAGTVAWQAGWAPVFTGPTADGGEIADDVTKDGEKRYVKEVAADVLGLTDDQASDLFISAGGIHGVIEYRNDFALQSGVPKRTWAVAR